MDDVLMESKLGWTAKIRRECHIGDFSRWRDHDEYQRAFARLLRDLRAEG